MASGAKRKLVLESSSESEELSDHDEDDIFEVERVLAEDLVEGQTFYLVKWIDYGDHRSTWEPIESFENDDTIREWRRELASGDTLDKDEVAAVQARMDAYIEKRERIAQKQERRRLKKKKQDAEARDRARVQTKQQKVTTETETESTTITVQPKPPKKGIAVSKPAAAPQPKPSISAKSLRSPSEPPELPKTSNAGSKAPPALPRKPSITAKSPMSPSEPPKSHAIASSRNTRRPSPPEAEKRRRSNPAGMKFKNLQHMNRAQKRLNAERTPVEALQLKPLADLGTSTTQEPDRKLPPKVRDDSPLFFPDTSAVAPHDRIEVGRKQISDDGSLFSGEGSPSLTTNSANAAPPPEVIVNPRPPIAPFEPPSVIRTKTGRSFKKDEILLRLKFGAHDAGDVRVLHFPHWLKSMIVKLKKADLLLLHFEQSIIFDATEFAEISRSWPFEAAAVGGIQPFPDTAASILELARYLEEHDIAALWEYPDEDSTLNLILYSPRAKSWSRYARQAGLQGCSLLLEARNRASQGSKAASIRPMQIDVPEPRPDPVLSGPGQAIFSNQLVVSTPLPPAQRLLLDTGVTTAGNTTSITPSIETPSLTRDPRKARAIDPVSRAVPDEKRFAVDGHSPLDGSDAKQANEQPKELDWSVNADFRLMTKTGTSSSGKAFVYIAFAEQHPQQAKTMKDWAGKHTSPRFVYTDADGESDWDDFRSGSNTALLLFHEGNPNFCVLKDMYHLLGRDNVVCYSVSWSTDSKEVKYSFSRLFPRGSVLLLTEYTITKHPQEAAFALEWFNQHSKKKGWMVMVRPNVRAWLQQTALECEDDEKAKQLFEILRLLFKMSSVPDVTIGDDVDRKDFLGIGNSQEWEKDNFIVPLPQLPEYDSSPSAEESAAAISKRDDLLLNHFIYWSIMNASSYRRFIALDDLQARKGMEKGAAKPEGAEHIKFWKPEAFMRDQQKSKGSEGDK